MTLVVKETKQFRKDLKLAWKQGRNLQELEHTMDLIANEKPLPPNYRDHTLSGVERSS